MLTITLDWLAMTFKEQTHEQEQFCDTYASFEKVSDARPSNGYTAAYSDQNGVVHMWNIMRPEMGHHVIFAGSVLRNVFGTIAVTQKGLVKAALNAGASLTRLDVAKDAQDVDCNVASIFAKCQAKQNIGNARTFKFWEDEARAQTLYIGSRTSERFARIYDKAGQLRMTDKKWTRYELELKGMVARAMASLIVDLDTWEGAFDAMALGMLDFADRGDYAVFFQQGIVPVGIPEIERTSNREKWIQETVISAVVEHYHEHPDSEAVRMMRLALDFQDEMKSR